MTLPDHYIVVDFETKDPYISRGYGSGWVFAINHDKEDFKLLGASVYDSKTEKTKYYCLGTCKRELREKLLSCKTVVMHNAQYDIGCVLVLFKGMPVFSLEDYDIYDTMLMAKLHKQDLMRYSLENCGEVFGMEHKKQKITLADYMWDSGLYAQIKEEETGRKVHTRPAENLINKVAITNLDLLPESLVGSYCNADVEATKDLFLYLTPLIDYDLKIMSDILKICIDIRLAGTRVNLDQAREVAEVLRAKEERILADIKNEFDLELNINSPKQLSEFLELVGIDTYPRTPKGNPSISTDYLRELDNEWAQRIADAREANKIRGSFIDKILNYQGFNNNINGSTGIMYTTLNPLGAVNTGRFTSGAGGIGSYELNIQQIPSSRTELGKLCRSLFLPNEGEKWIKADFSNQEPRIQVHYAVKLGCDGAKEVAEEWSANPTISFHDKVAEITGLDKPNAKVINLGLAYGMGDGKVCEKLGLPASQDMFINEEGEVIQYLKAGREGKDILEQYHEMLPFMQQVTTMVNNHFRHAKYVRTLGGRKLTLSNFGKICMCRGNKKCMHCKKGFSKLIQGSAADQTMAALIACKKAGLKILNTVHDEINISSDNVARDAKILKDCMEQAMPVVVPMIADIEVGDNWAEVITYEFK